jgi:hypothetical protein
MNKIQSAFTYLLNLLDGVYGNGWEISEAYADAAIEFGLDERESQQLQQIHQSFTTYFLN